MVAAGLWSGMWNSWNELSVVLGGRRRIIGEALLSCWNAFWLALGFPLPTAYPFVCSGRLRLAGICVAFISLASGFLLLFLCEKSEAG
jgi:hypothetical protein